MILPVTVVIPVKNDAGNLERCLTRLIRFSRVVVIDSSSTDETKQVARAHGAEILNFSWNGHYPKKRNWFLLNHKPLTPWVLFLDADELITNEFCEEIATKIMDDEIHGYWLNYTNYFLGKRLRFGEPQRKLSLFRVGKALYERIDEDAWSELDMEVHEHPIVNGLVGEIFSPIDHKNDRSLLDFWGQHVRYAQWEVKRFQALKKDLSAWKILTQRQKFKYHNISRPWFSTVYFFYVYVFKFGILDGRAGFLYAFHKARYFHKIRLVIKKHNNLFY